MKLELRKETSIVGYTSAVSVGFWVSILFFLNFGEGVLCWKIRYQKAKTLDKAFVAATEKLLAVLAVKLISLERTLE